MPTYDDGTEGEPSTQETSYTSQGTGDASTSSPYPKAQRGYTHGSGEELSEMAADETLRESESSGEFHERDLEPPRLSEASRAATERHGRIDGPLWAPVESPYEKLKRDVDNDFFHAANDVDLDAAGPSRGKSKASSIETASTTPKAVKGTKYTTNLLRQQHEQLSRSARKLQATPKQINPFTTAKAPDTARKGGNTERWNGIADLRKTPLAKIKGIPKHTRANLLADDTIDSLPPPPGMSPPVNTLSSAPQRKYGKTPAKMAANLAVNELLHSIEVASPATRRRILEKHIKDSAAAGTRMPSNNLTSTPLRKPIQKGRKSLPTPPTVTKRIGRSTLSRGAQGVDSPAGASSARLFDEDEAGDDLRDEGGEAANDLGSGLSKLALSRSPRGMDRLLDINVDDEEDSSGDEDDESDSDEEEEIGQADNLSRASATTLQSALKRSGVGIDYPTGSSLASISRSIDQDTLFGIRDPNKSLASGEVGQGSVTSHSRARASSALGRQKEQTLAREKREKGKETYQPMGARLYEQGTVYSGRPLLGDDREDTYSAPSPSPALAAASSRKSR